MRSPGVLCIGLTITACEKVPPVPTVTELQPFSATTEAWSGGEVTVTSAAFTTSAALPELLLDEQPLAVRRVDDTTIAAALPDLPGPHVLRLVAPHVERSPVVIHLRGFVERTEGPALSGRIEPGRDPRYVFGSGPTSLRRWNVATNKAVDLGDSVHAVSCTGGVGPGPNVGELVLLTGGCDRGRWMLWRTEPLAPLSDTTSVATDRFVAILRTGRWVVLNGGVFSVVACEAGSAAPCTSEAIGGADGSDVVRSPRGDRAALLARTTGNAESPGGGVPVVDVAAGTLGYRVPALTAAQGAAFSRGGDTLFLAGESTATFALVAVGASDGALLTSRRLDYQPCAVATDTLGSWLYVAGVSTTSASPRSLLQVFDRGTMNVVTTLHVKSDVLYGQNVCRILQNPLEHRVYVVDTWAGEPTVAARAQLYSFETPR